mgnify:CR=1 FL=1
MAAGFQIKHWAAIAPGLRDAEAWRAWAASPFVPDGDIEAPLSAMPAMQRRRVERGGRLALQVAFDVDAEDSAPDFARRPMVFASRHGDVLRSVLLLDALNRGEALSPTQFGLSVHNAVAAQYGIARGSTAPYSAVAGGRFSAEAGVIEAQALLDDGHDEVLLVVFDEPLPSLFDRDADEPALAFAWAVRMERATSAGFRIGTVAQTVDDHGLAPAVAVPHSLKVLGFLLAPRAAWTVSADGSTWHWSHGA